MFSKDDDRHPLSNYLDQFNLPPWLKKDKKKDSAPQLTPIPPLELFLGSEHFSTRTLLLSTLLERTLGGNGEGNYQSIDHLLGRKPSEIEADAPGSGLAIALQKIVVNEEAGISLGGSIIADCIGTTNEHMVKNSDFLAKMQWLYGKRINPKYLKTEALPDEHEGTTTKPLRNHLIRALYGGVLDLDKMSPSTYSLFRLLQKWAGANADLVVRSPLGNSPESRSLIRDLIATNFAFLDPHHARNISTVSYGKTNLIHIDHPYSRGKDINLIVKGLEEENQYSEITTWRKASTTTIPRNEDGIYTVKINPEDFRQYNQMLFMPDNYWSWLTYAYKNARNILVAGVPRIVFDQKSFLKHMPSFNPNPSQEQLANIAANAVHASAINNDDFSSIVDDLNLLERLNLNDYDEIRSFIINGLADLFIDPPHENIEPFIDEIVLALTKYLPVSLSRFIKLTPGPGNRDQVKARRIIQPPRPRVTSTITPYGAEALKSALALAKDGSLNPKETRLIQNDIETLSKV